MPKYFKFGSWSISILHYGYTLIATKVFKDGDLVEVDAERGVVRKV